MLLAMGVDWRAIESDFFADSFPGERVTKITRIGKYFVEFRGLSAGKNNGKK